MQFPVAMPGEGVVDVVVQGLVGGPPGGRRAAGCSTDDRRPFLQVPRATLANAITGAEKGKQFYMDCVSIGGGLSSV